MTPLLVTLSGKNTRKSFMGDEYTPDYGAVDWSTIYQAADSQQVSPLLPDETNVLTPLFPGDTTATTGLSPAYISDISDSWFNSYTAPGNNVAITQPPKTDWLSAITSVSQAAGTVLASIGSVLNSGVKTVQTLDPNFLSNLFNTSPVQKAPVAYTNVSPPPAKSVDIIPGVDNMLLFASAAVAVILIAKRK